MDHDDGDFVGVVGLEEVESGFLHVAFGEEDVLDGEVVEQGHLPVEGDGGGPIGIEGLALFADGGFFDDPAFGEFPCGLWGIEIEDGGEGVGDAGGWVEGWAWDGDGGGFFPSYE